MSVYLVWFLTLSIKICARKGYQSHNKEHLCNKMGSRKTEPGPKCVQLHITVLISTVSCNSDSTTWRLNQNLKILTSMLAVKCWLEEATLQQSIPPEIQPPRNIYDQVQQLNELLMFSAASVPSLYSRCYWKKKHSYVTLLTHHMKGTNTLWWTHTFQWSLCKSHSLWMIQ